MCCICLMLSIITSWCEESNAEYEWELKLSQIHSRKIEKKKENTKNVVLGMKKNVEYK